MHKNVAIFSLVIGAFLMLLGFIVMSFNSETGAPFMGIAFFLFFGGGIPNIFYYFKIKKFAQSHSDYKSGLAILEKEAEAFSKTIMYLNYLPKDYRSSLAIDTMIDMLERGKAFGWTVLIDKYDEQVHRWVVEMNTAEAAEYSKYAALMSDVAANNANRAANNAGIAACFSILNIFW